MVALTETSLLKWAKDWEVYQTASLVVLSSEGFVYPILLHPFARGPTRSRFPGGTLSGDLVTGRG